MRFSFFLCIVISFFLIAAHGDTLTAERDYVANLMLSHHSGKYFQWNECGNGLALGAGERRAYEYADAILESIRNIEVRHGERIDPRHVRAILYRESSDDECIVGFQEARRLSETVGQRLSKKEIVLHVKKWWAAYQSAVRWCKRSDVKATCEETCKTPGQLTKEKCIRLCSKYRSGCVYSRMNERYPQYQGIHAWDLGAGQFRFPSTLLGKTVTMPDGRVAKVSIESLFNYRISVQLLVESLAKYKKECRSHVHYLKKRGKIVRKLTTEEAYYAHHNTGTESWSQAYWERVNRDIEAADRWEPNSRAMAQLEN